MAIFAVLFAGCTGGDNIISVSGKLSPPSWIRGSWGVDMGEGYGMFEVLKFTSDDMLILGQSYKTFYGTTTGPGVNFTMKETKNTSSLYEITITAKAGSEKESVLYSFKKGDGTYIEALGWDDDDDNAIYTKLYKM